MAIIIALRAAIYLPEDWVVRKGEVGRHLYIIRVGSVAVMDEDENGIKDPGDVGEHTQMEAIAILEEGSFFGELALLMDRKRTVSVKALGFCEISTLVSSAYTQH